MITETSSSRTLAPLKTQPESPTTCVSHILSVTQPFIYYHTREITEAILSEAVSTSKSLEIDLASRGDGTIFVGHPDAYYRFHNKTPYRNLPLEKIMARVKETDLLLVLDCKDAGALPKAIEIAQEIGPERCLFHAWSAHKAVHFTPYPRELVVEPHWENEQLPWEGILAFKQQTRAPIILSCRGLTRDRLLRNRHIILSQIIETAQGNVDVINFNLPGNEAPPREIMEELLRYDILTWLKIEHVPPEQRPAIYLGSSDALEHASHLLYPNYA